nr:reverse transcriptase domain-containing protein [Tanacetum cinerariifolium]
MVQWTTETNEAFRRMKECLESLPTMVIPTKGETLTVYLAASEKNVSAVLMGQRGKKQALVYFIHCLRKEKKRRMEGPKEKNQNQRILVNMVEVCKANAGQKHHKGSARRANGQVEVTNREIVKGMERRLEMANRAWVDELPQVLWAHRTTPKSSNGETSFSLVYESKDVIPIEISRKQSETSIPRKMKIRRREDLDVLEERRVMAAINEAHYKQKLEGYYNKNVKPFTFKPGTYVLRLNSTSKAEYQGKMGPTWEGPYRVRKAYGDRAYKLETLYGKAIDRTWNETNLRKWAGRSDEQRNHQRHGTKTRNGTPGMDLDVLEERREMAAIKEAHCKQKLEGCYNKNVKPGTSVLRLNSASKAEYQGKIRPTWEGTYRLRKAYGYGAYKLETLFGEAIDRTWNGINLRKFYV